ncbi:MAG: hypothetical protein AB7Q01_14635 [Gammaproteobacteria bacterium]
MNVRQKIPPALKADPITAAREAVRAARHELGEILAHGRDLQSHRTAFLEARDALPTGGPVLGRLQAVAQLYEAQRGALRRWREALEIECGRIEHPELFALDSPGQIDNAWHAVIEAYAALKRAMDSLHRRAKFRAGELEQRYASLLAAQLLDELGHEARQRVGMYLSAAARAGTPAAEAINEIADPAVAAAALDGEFYNFGTEVVE